MTEHYCQMDMIEAGIWSVFDERVCCGKPAPFHIVVWGARWYLCPEHYDWHAGTRDIFQTDGENLDAQGNPL